MTNDGGTLLGTRHFAPFGEPSGSDGVGERIAEWAAYEKDPNDLTHNLKARTYYHGYGRFFTPDPARDGWNLYAYAANNPITNFDPTGLQCTDPGQSADSGKQGNECGGSGNAEDDLPVEEFEDTITVRAKAPTLQELIAREFALALEAQAVERETPSDRELIRQYLPASIYAPGSDYDRFMKACTRDPFCYSYLLRDMRERAYHYWLEERFRKTRDALFYFLHSNSVRRQLENPYRGISQPGLNGQRLREAFLYGYGPESLNQRQRRQRRNR